MRRTGLVVAVAMAASLVAAPALAGGPPAETGNSLPQEVMDQRVSLFFCPDPIYVGPEEPFNITNGYGLMPTVETNIGQYTFEVAINGVVQPSKMYNVVNHAGAGPPAFTRWFVHQFPNGLSDGDQVEGFWYDPTGLARYCDTSIVIGDPPE